MPRTPKNQPEKPKKANQKRKPLGEAIEWTDEDLTKLAEISPADIKAADATWKNNAPAKVKKLLEADVKEEK